MSGIIFTIMGITSLIVCVILWKNRCQHNCVVCFTSAVSCFIGSTLLTIFGVASMMSS